MSWWDLYTIVEQMTSGFQPGGRACFAALVAAFLYHERYHTANAVDLLARIKSYGYRKAYRKIEKFLHRKVMRFDPVWQWLWDQFTAQLRDCFVLVDWTMWADGRQVLMAAVAHSGRCLPCLAVAYDLKAMTRSQNQAEQSFFLLLKMLGRVGQQITAIKDRGFGRIALLQAFSAWQLHFITRVCHGTYFSNPKYQGLLKEFPLRPGDLIDLGRGQLGKDPKHQVTVRLMLYWGKGHQAAWFIATDRLDLTPEQIIQLYAHRMGIEAAFRDTKGMRYGWGLRKVQLRSDVQLTALWAAAMVAYALRMAAGAYVSKQDRQAMFNWTRKGPRRSLLSVGRNALTSGLLELQPLLAELPCLALSLKQLSSKLPQPT
jgi:Transposase DDE domain